MTNYHLSIQLLSDLCCGTGEGNGSNMDQCTAFDAFGIPYIPGKRLKGLLRDQAEFLAEHGYLGEDVVQSLFGDKNGKGGAIRVNNALIPGHAVIAQEIAGHASKNEVSAAFTATRTQTAMEADGTAKMGSLRVTQVVTKENERCFETNITVMRPDKDLHRLLHASAKTLRQIGLNKTRGFGEVICTLTELSTAEQQSGAFKAGAPARFSYTVELLDDVVINGGSNHWQDYISGAMMQGAFARYAAHYDGFTEFFLRNVRFSHAYINGYAPIPLSVVAAKNKPEKAYNLADSDAFKDPDEQYVPVNGYGLFDGGVLEKASVESAIEYHYATKTQNLFTYRKIIKGQQFRGEVSVSPDNAAVLRRILHEQAGILLLGGSSSAQYARCRVTIGDAVQPRTIRAKGKLIVELLSDAVIRDAYGAISGNVEHLVTRMAKLLHADGDRCTVYAKTMTGGGFNNKWKLPIQQYTAFVGGSVLVFEDAQAENIQETGYIADIIPGGYGTYHIRTPRDAHTYAVHTHTPAAAERGALSAETQVVLDRITRNRNVAICRAEAVQAANMVQSELAISNIMRTHTAYRLYPNKASFLSYIKTNFREGLLDFASKMVQSFESLNLPDDLFGEYIRAFIAQVKRNDQKGESR